MPNTHATLTGLFTDIADAIRAKTGESGSIVADQFPEAIADIPAGTEGVPGQAVNFIDYDGTVLHSYTAAEFAALSALPENPSHDGLVAQGWNWTLADAKSYVSYAGFLDIGQMYNTDDGSTRLYIRVETGRLSPYLGLAPNGSVKVDWGDGSAVTTVTGTSTSTVKSTQHTYAAPGEYVITLTLASGSCTLPGHTDYGSQVLWKNDTSSGNVNRVYNGILHHLELGDGFSVANYAFSRCWALETVTLPRRISGMSGYMFGYCHSLRSLTVPVNVSSISAGACLNYCYSLKTLSLPKGLSGIRGLGNCYTLKRLATPPSATYFDNWALESCYALSAVVIPGNVTNLYSGVFSSCYGLGYIYFVSTTPPAVSNSNAFNNVPTDCKIYVPASALSAYKSATNYPSSGSYTYVGYGSAYTL